ncbi:MAG: DUF1508 domain-containing protein [Spirochaetaceae bacterium]|jgi:uncharacterized protein YegP (UPF0339 family)|nr:DUF1508 domain-containing protein [Spirochaetaceae bacterium]
MAAKFTVYLDKAKQYRFSLKASNGEIIASSEAYTDKKSAFKGIASIQKNAVVAKIVDETGESKVPQKTGQKPSAARANTAAVRKQSPK